MFWGSFNSASALPNVGTDVGGNLTAGDAAAVENLLYTCTVAAAYPSAVWVQLGWIFPGQAQGDILYFDGAVWATLPAGAVGQFLRTGGLAANPSWSTPAGAGDVTAAANLTDNSIIRGDGGVKGVQDATEAGGIDWTIDDTGRLVAVANNTTAAGWVASLKNLASAGPAGGKGLLIMTGEVLGDIALRISDRDDTFGNPGGAIMEVEADNGYVTFYKSYAQTLIDNGVVHGIDNQGPGATKDFNTEFGSYRIAGEVALTGQFTTTTPSPPATGASIFTRFRAGRQMASQEPPVGADYAFQPWLAQQKVGWWSALGNATTVNTVAFGNTATGTATTRNVATTGLLASLRRVGYVSSAIAGNSAGTRHGATQFWRGNAAGLGGFTYVARFGLSHLAPVADMRWFVGMLGSAAVIANVNPSTLTNMVGFGIDSAQTTVRFFYNDAAGVATAIDLGVNFPATTANVVYEARIFCAPNSTSIFYSLERYDVAALAEGSVAGDIPAAVTLLGPQIWVNNGLTALAVAVDVVSQYIETDY